MLKSFMILSLILIGIILYILFILYREEFFEYIEGLILGDEEIVEDFESRVNSAIRKRAQKQKKEKNNGQIKGF
ncbi:hypothetical protein IJD34_03710 [bacterium]|nr:hypothetical protein [bacterium]